MPITHTTVSTITTYVSDMLAVTRKMAQPLEHQANDDALKACPQAARVVNLKELAVMGNMASVMGSVRKTEVSKYLRDYYSALSFASAAYTMLHGIGAERHHYG